MKKMFFTALVCVATALIIVAFFMPWATVATSVTGISKGLTGALSGTPVAGKIVGDIEKATDVIGQLGDVSIKSTVSGYQVPILVNDDTSKVAISLAQMFFKDAQDLDKKSYLVYLLPILGIMCAGLAILGRGNKISIILMILLSGGVAGAGLYHLYTMDISSLVVKISIKNGLWYTMYSFLFIAVVGLVELVIRDKK